MSVALRRTALAGLLTLTACSGTEETGSSSTGTTGLPGLTTATGGTSGSASTGGTSGSTSGSTAAASSSGSRGTSGGTVAGSTSGSASASGSTTGGTTGGTVAGSTSGSASGSTSSGTVGSSGGTITGSASTGSSGTASTSTAASSTGGATGSSTTGSGSTGSTGSTGSSGSSGGSGSDFACLGSVVAPSPVGSTATVSVQFTDLNSGAIQTGLDVKVCNRTDSTCANPVGTTSTNSNGIATMTVPLGTTGFDGYLEVTSQPNASVQIVPLLQYFKPIVKDGSFQGRTVQPSDLSLIFLFTGASNDTTKGLVAGAAWDCGDDLALGIQAALDPAQSTSTRIYFRNGFPSTSAADTDATGFFGFLNVQTGTATVKGSVTASGNALGNETVLVRPGTISSLVLYPR